VPQSIPDQEAQDLPALEAIAGQYTVEGLWLRAFMVDGTPRPHSGWKLHISFGPADYDKTVAAVVGVLGSHRVPFKVIRSRDALEHLNDGAYGLLQSGKAVTVYPATEAQAADLAAELARALEGVPGPPVLTDCPYSYTAPVYFRYGPNELSLAVDPLGRARRLVQVGEGRFLPDDHDPACWPAREYLPDTTPIDHLAGLREQYTLTNVLHLSAKGGVFLARGEPGSILIKTSRRGAHPDVHGRDAAWALAREHALLQRLSDLEGLPEAGKWHEDDHTVAVIRPYLPGITWRELWEQPDAATATGRARLAEVLQALRDQVMALHAAGVAVRDISPDNVLVTPEGPVMLDLELAHEREDGTPPYRRGTRGFYEPKDSSPDPFAQDDYALDALGVMAEAGIYPAWFHGGVGDGMDRMAALGSAAAAPLPRDEVRRRIARLTRDETPDAQNVYTGVAGWALLLAETGQTDLLGEAEWAAVAGALDSAPHLLAHIHGFYFGVAGVHLARAVVGLITGDDYLREAGETGLYTMAVEDSAVWDLCHGRAGYAWACLAAGEVLGDASLLGRGVEAARTIAEHAAWQDDACAWPWPEDAAYGSLSGAVLPGFAHGTAGILYVLSRAHRLAPDEALARAIRGGVRYLATTARPVETDTGAGVWWGYDATDRKVWNGWNHGNPGVIKGLAAARRAVPECCDDAIMVTALRGMGAANNGGYALAQGVASRLDAYAEALPLLDVLTRAPFQEAAERDAATLRAIDPFTLEASAGDPPPEGTGEGLMLGAPGVWLTLLRFRTEEIGAYRELLP
jgi:serine/threonine protein kinase